MKALKVVGIILLILVVLFFVVALFLPSKVRMEESLVINRPASLIFKQINNFHNWNAWSPWLETDPDMQIQYEGPETGEGASYSWTSSIHGNGKMTILESVPYEKVTNELKFMEQKVARTDFYLEESGDGTKVTWTTDIPHLAYPVERYFGLFMPGLMSKFFSTGLSNLAEVTAGMPDPVAIEKVTLPETGVMTILDSCHWKDFEATLGAMYTELMGFIQGRKDVNMAGFPYTMYTKWDENEQFAVFEAGIPVDNETRTLGRVKYKIIPEKNAIKATHFGRYEDVGVVYMALEEYVKEFKLEEDCCPMEVYVTDPTMEPDTAKWQTDVYFPLK